MSTQPEFPAQRNLYARRDSPPPFLSHVIWVSVTSTRVEIHTCQQSCISGPSRNLYARRDPPDTHR